MTAAIACDTVSHAQKRSTHLLHKPRQIVSKRDELKRKWSFERPLPVFFRVSIGMRKRICDRIQRSVLLLALAVVGL